MLVKVIMCSAIMATRIFSVLNPDCSEQLSAILGQYISKTPWKFFLSFISHTYAHDKPAIGKNIKT